MAAVTRLVPDRPFTLLLVFVCLWLSACTPKSQDKPQGPPDPNQTFDSIAQQLDQGKHALALEPARQAWLRSTSGSEWRWKFQLLYAQVLLFNLSTTPAADLLKVPPPPEYGALLPRYQYLKAYVLFRTSNQAAAAEGLARAAVAGAKAGDDGATETEALLLLAKFLKDPARARQAALQAYESAHAHALPVKEAASLLNLGLDAMRQGHLAEAIPYFKQAAPVAERVHAHYIQVLALSDLGECYYTLGDFDRAFRTLSQARPQLLNTDSSDLKFYVNYELGYLYLLRRQLPEAVASFRQSVSLAERASNDYVMSTTQLAETLLRQGLIDEAEKYNENAQSVLTSASNPRQSLQASIDLNRADIAAARGALQSAAEVYQKVIRSQDNVPASAVQWSAFANLGSVQEQLGQWQAASGSYEQALSSIEAGRSAQKTVEYQITYLTALIRFYQQYVALLIRQHEQDKALAVADSSRASLLTQGSLTSRELPNFPARLRQLAHSSQSVILFYWLAEKSSYLWAITPTESRLLTLPGQAEITRDVESYSSFIQAERQDTLASSNAIGKRLYQTLLGQVADQIPPDSRVVIVPDGALHNLNFETLLVDKPKPHYWLDDVTVTIAPSLGILLAPSAPTKPPAKRALLIGNAIYDGVEYHALPQSAVEIESVRKHFAGAATVIEQRAATAAAYKSADPGLFSTIHLSAHVDADAQSPLDSAIILSPSDSGNRLYAREVDRIPLTADLVTISGCSGAGVKALSGEGLVGFAWASLHAGAHNAVTSLWEVDDRSTADLMDRFYAGVVAGEPYSVALRKAKSAMLKSHYGTPYYWAPFQLYSRSIATPEHAANQILLRPNQRSHAFSFQPGSPAWPGQ